MLLKAVLLVALATTAFAAVDHVVGGAFTSVDSVPATGYAAFRHPAASAQTTGDSKRYPNGQFLLPLGTAPGFVSGSSLHAYAQDGSIVGANVGAAPGLASNSELWMVDNSTSQFVRRLFGFNGFFGFDNGQPSGQPNPRSSSNYVGLIQNLAFLGSAPSRRLVVCMGFNGASTRLLVGNTSLPNPSTRNPTPSNLQNQLLLFTEGSTSSFLSTGFVVNTPVSATPTTITPRYSPANSDSQPGVDCTTLVAGGKTVIIRTPAGPYYLTNDVGSVSPTTWTQMTGDPAKSGSTPLTSPLSNPFYLLNPEQGNPTVYWYGVNPSDGTFNLPNDAYNTFYKYSAGASWSVVVPTSVIRNLTVVQYVVGNGGDSEIYFTLAPSDQDSVPSFIDDIRMPVEQYVFQTSSSSFNYIAPLWQLSRTGAINLHYDINLKSLVVFSTDLSGAVVGNRLTYKVPEDDRRYFSKSFAFVARYDSANSRWVQAYGGGFDGSVGRIVSTTNGVTYFEGGFKYAFQRATGPMAMYNPTLGVWDYSYGAGFERVDIDGGDMRGIFNSGPAVYDVQRMSFLGNDGFIVAGSYRTSDDGTVPCNSICFFPANNGAKVALFDNPTSSFYNNSGVRMADPISASAIIPEHADSVPGLVTNVITDGASIYVGGTFQIAGDKAASNFAVYTVSSSKYPTGWSNALGGVDGPIWSMVKYGGAIIVGGSFQTVGSTIKAQNIAGFDLNTRTWFTLNRGLDGTVYKLIPYDGKLLAVGTFASGSGQTLGFAGLWDGQKWAPMTTDARLPKNNCLYTYCLLSDISGATGAYDAFVYGKTPYFVLATGSGVRLVRFETKYDGFMTVDGNAFEGAVATFTNGFSVPTGASYFAGSPLGGRRFDLWNVEQAGQAGQLQSKGVSCYNVGYDNFENNGNTGTNGLVYIALPENKVSMSAALVASMALVFAALAVLLL